MRKFLLLGLMVFSISCFAEIEHARDLMEKGSFKEAMTELWPAARSGNADAEELIGVMYAMGLGVPQDDERAFEWYLRSSMKGHPGAQSGVGWYYEVGRGVEKPDLVRAYMWYNIGAYGGNELGDKNKQLLANGMDAAQLVELQALSNTCLASGYTDC